MKVVYLNVTKNCNSNCLFCAAELNYAAKDHSYMNAGEIATILNELSVGPHDRIILNGGEPTLNPELIQIINLSSRTGASVELFTNGVKFEDHNFASFILQTGVNRISIPVYSHEDSIHDYITDSKGSWNRTILGIHNIKTLKKPSVELELKTIICRANMGIIEDIVNFITQELCPDRFVLSGLIPSVGAYANRQVLTKEEDCVAANKAVDTFFRESRRTEFLIDGIPICHLSDKNRMFYLTRKLLQKNCNDRENEASLSIAFDKAKGSIIRNSDDICRWDKKNCPVKDCKYIGCCRLNTLINHRGFLETWI